MVQKQVNKMHVCVDVLPNTGYYLAKGSVVKHPVRRPVVTGPLFSRDHAGRLKTRGARHVLEIALGKSFKSQTTNDICEKYAQAVRRYNDMDPEESMTLYGRPLRQSEDVDALVEVAPTVSPASDAEELNRRKATVANVSSVQRRIWISGQRGLRCT